MHTQPTCDTLLPPSFVCSILTIRLKPTKPMNYISSDIIITYLFD